MKSIKYFLVSVILALTIISAGIYSSCTKDACKTTNCINGGTCGGGNCTCPTGIGGLNCEIIYRNLYANTYKGSGADDSGKPYIDNIFSFTVGADSNYVQMQLAWNNAGPHLINFPITLANNTANGSTFTIAQTTVDSFTYTGSGSVNSNLASLTLRQISTDSTIRIIILNNFIRQ